MAGLSRTIPALPVRDIETAVAHLRDRMGFAPLHVDHGFAVLQRDEARLHLWRADDLDWGAREDLRERPVRSGAESFLAGTASCRIETEDVDGLYAELAATGVLHPVSQEGLTDTGFGTREFATTDADGNLIEFFRWLSNGRPAPGITGIDHVQVAAPPGCETQARAFYGELLGLEELGKPAALAARGGVWFRVGEQQLHVGVEDAFRPARKAHAALRAGSQVLDGLAARLSAAGFSPVWDTEIPGVRRCYVDDPWGNRLELVG